MIRNSCEIEIFKLSSNLFRIIRSFRLQSLTVKVQSFLCFHTIPSPVLIVIITVLITFTVTFTILTNGI